MFSIAQKRETFFAQKCAAGRALDARWKKINIQISLGNIQISLINIQISLFEQRTQTM